ncbi:MAG: hypothetical protein IIA66_04580 [Planctomycetes bacterium]|nr:hypothetical protein [Planctomycetota bacterium]
MSGSRSYKFHSALGGPNDARSTPELAVDGPNAFDTLGNVTDGLTRTAQGGDPACGPNAGDCCQAGGNGSPGCDDEDCCNCICACDPFCCGNEPLGFWDSLCAGEGFVPGCGASDPNGLCATECSECLPSFCGDGVCDPDEDCASCPADCGQCGGNDDCAGAIPVAVPSTTAGSTTGTTPDSAPFCGTSDGTGGAVWYSVIGTGNRITATTCDSTNGDFCTGGGSANYDTKIRVYTEGCAALNCEAGNDDNCTGGSSGLRSTVSWCSTEGTEYLILVHGFSGNEGDFVLEVCDDGVGCAGPVCPLSSCEGSTATVTQSNTTSNGNNQVACVAGGNTTENAWARCYDLAAEGVSEDLTINSVTFGVQQATIDGIDVNVNLYLDSDGCPPGEPGVDAILLDSVSTVVNTADEDTFITLNFPGGPVAPAGSTLIVEIEAPADGTEEPLHAFRAMSNPDGQCGSSYLRAADCGLGSWTALEDIGFPDAHLVQIVNGTSDCGCQSDDECDDGDACTGDTCDDGGCVHTPVDCSGAGDQCNTASCDPNGAEGNCDTLTPVADGTLCNDGAACTENDQCTAGNCGGTAVDCSAAGDQCNSASCDPGGAEGNCDTLTPVADGTPCEDSDLCTAGDECSSGECIGGPFVECPEGETCDPKTGVCVGCGPCPTDVDGDGNTGASDLAVLLGSWGPCAPGNSCACLDADGDLNIGAFDLAFLLGAWGPCD